MKMVGNLVQDVRYAVRQLRKNQGFACVVVASLALAIGVNTTIFSYVNRMLYMRLGLPHAGELRLLSLRGDEHMLVHSFSGNGSIGAHDSHLDAFSYPVYQELRKRNTVLGDLVAFNDRGSESVTLDGVARTASAEAVSGNFYTVMQIRPELGRGILPGDDGAPGSGSVVVISDRFWHSAFGGARDVIGKVIRVGATPLTIVGVNPPEYIGAQAGSPAVPELYIPLSLAAVLNPGRGDMDLAGPSLWWLQVMGRVRPEVSKTQAEAALSVALNAAVRATTTLEKDETMPRVVVQDGSRGDDFGIAELAKPTYILMGLAGLVLLLACANIANLMLARATVRQREMGVRMALGAGRARILRQLLTESLLLAAIAGVCGLSLGYTSRNLIPALMKSGWEGGEFNVPFDWRVFGFTAAITLTAGVVFGLAPAWRATRVELNTTLKEGSRSATRSRKSRGGKALVAFQVMLSTLLVMTSALFVRTITKLEAVDPGFRAKGLMLFSVSLPAAEYPAPKDIAGLYRIEAALAAVPGVQGVTASSMPLVAGWQSSGSFYVEGAPVPTKETQGDYASFARVGGSFFSTMSIPILAGRGLNDHDTETSPHVAVVNQALAQRFFPGVNPIGRRFRTSYDPKDAAEWIEIVGVCANSHYQSLKEETPRTFFTPYRQAKEMADATYMVRSELPAAVLLPALRHAVQQVDANLPMRNIRTQQEQIDETMQQERMFATLTAGFGLLALVLACVGVYGIMAYTVSQRTNEIGIRLALGAWRGQIGGMVLREASWIAGAGVLLGLATTLLLARLVQAMLFGVKPYDAVSLGGSSLVLLAMALLASLIPAVRAASIDPMEALRNE
ncbi:ABC transporter permease [Granulicella aggregans]|uniref:ABC transporter permease n=1 Tax=Granulicella aggregans TaxID=474949 RepID=UPI0021E03594|nr:ABC transporter permease [Granulicella aggregans]